MAKRKRLGPALLNGDYPDPPRTPAPDPEAGPPIARIASDTSSRAAFEDVARALSEARDEGWLAQHLPLDAIEAEHLARDRIAFEDAEMTALVESLQSRGQQVPIEVVDKGEGRFGLISGLRRVMALRELGATEVLAVLRRPENAAEAYLAMVEENEIRAGISFYERARIACEAVRLGIHPDVSTAIQTLFPGASAAKRSKIGTFATLHEALGDTLRFPAAIPERLGLALGAVIGRNAKAAERVSRRLAVKAPETSEAERVVIEACIAEARSAGARGGRGRPPVARREIRPGLTIERRGGRAILSGEALTDDLVARLEAWLAES